MVKRRKKRAQYAPSRRLAELRLLLHATGGVTIYEIAERLSISIRTALRYLKALEDVGERLYEDSDGRRKIWRVMPSAREAVFRLTTSQMVSLYMTRRVTGFLDGTGFKEDLDDVYAQLDATLQRKDFVAAANLDKKMYDVNEAPYRYAGRIEDVNDIVTALLKDDRLLVRHQSVARGKLGFRIDPYTLLVYKKGLYLAGHSHHHGGVRTFALDGFRKIAWKKGERFEYPADYDPARLVEGAFGLFGGALTRVRIHFSSKVARYVERREWHPSQKLRAVAGGIELELELRGTTELSSWVLSFGDQAQVLEPAELKESIKAELERARARYQENK